MKTSRSKSLHGFFHFMQLNVFQWRAQVTCLVSKIAHDMLEPWNSIDFGHNLVRMNQTFLKQCCTLVVPVNRQVVEAHNFIAKYLGEFKIVAGNIFAYICERANAPRCAELKRWM